MKSKVVFFPLLAALLFACKPIPKADSGSQGLYQSGALWPNATASVCFADDAQGNAAMRSLIHDTVEEEINQRTSFRFSGFKLCSEAPMSHIEVRIGLVGRDNAGGIGDSRDDLQKLLSHFVPARRYRAPMHLYYRLKSNAITNKHEVQNTIVHEFGHALGLHHEQLRSENANGNFCNEGIGKEPEGAIKVGSFDYDSIMNYCNIDYFYRKIGLSKGDIATIEKMYGRNNSAESSRSVNGSSNTQLRCNKSSLVSCIQQKGGAACVDKNCNGGAYLCTSPGKLRECLKFSGGLSCLGNAQGQCEG